MSESQADEPIRHLSAEEFAALRASIRESRKATHNKSRIQINANKIAEAEYAAGEEGMELGLKVWQMRKAGYSRSEIRKELGISLTVMDTCLREFELRMGMESARAMEHYRLIDDERIEDMLRYWLPIACHGRIRIEHVRDGEVFSEVDFDRPLKAGFFVLAAMNMRLKLMQAARPEGVKEGSSSVLIWLQSILPGVQKVVRNIEETSPKLILETEVENGRESEAR